MIKQGKQEIKKIMKLICFPHAGGFSVYFHFLRKIPFLKKENIYLYDYPGRGARAREPAADSLLNIAEQAARSVASFVGDEEFCIFGHSMGAFVAYETEAYLEQQFGRQACRLIVSGQHAPVCFDHQHYMFATQEQADSYLKELGGFPEEIFEHRAFCEEFFALCRKDICLLQGYSPTCRVVQAPTSVVCGDSDIEVGDVSRLSQWSQSSALPVDITIFPGSHFYMKEQETDFLQYMSSQIGGTTA